MSDRTDFIATCVKDGISVDTAEWVLTAARELYRLAERECNGTDWETKALVACPQVGKTLKWCPDCSGSNGEHYEVTKSSIKIAKTEDLIRRVWLPKHEVQFSGDPRGAVVKIRFKKTRGNSFGGDNWYCVP